MQEALRGILVNFQKFMAGAGDMDVMGKQYARMQLLTVPKILEGKRFDTPGTVGKAIHRIGSIFG